MTIPTTLDEAVDQIIASMNEEAKAGWAASEDGYQAMLHHGYGTHLRNEWGLWFNETPIAKWFLARGLWMADDRSGVILDAVHARLKGLPFSIEEEVAHYRAFWKARGFDENGERIPGFTEPIERRLKVTRKDGKTRVEDVE